MKASKALVVFFLTLSMAQAQYQIRNLNLVYQDPQGAGKVDLFIIGEDQQRGAFKVDRIADEIFLQFSSETLRWEAVDRLVDSFDTVELDNINLELTEQNYRASMQKAELSGKDSGLSIAGLRAQCAAGDVEDLINSLLINCVQRGRLQLKSFATLEGAKRAESLPSYRLSDFLWNIIPEHLVFKDIIAFSGVEMSDVKLDITRGNFDGEARVSMGINLGLNFRGKIQHLSSGNVLRIKIDRVRAGIFNVTGRVFNELKNLKTDGVRINRPYIEIDL